MARDITYYCPFKGCSWNSVSVTNHKAGRERQVDHLHEHGVQPIPPEELS